MTTERTPRRGVRGQSSKFDADAAELVALAPDVTLAHGSPAMPPLLQATRTVPIVFTVVFDPVAVGFVGR